MYIHIKVYYIVDRLVSKYVNFRPVSRLTCNGDRCCVCTGMMMYHSIYVHGVATTHTHTYTHIRTLTHTYTQYNIYDRARHMCVHTYIHTYKRVMCVLISIYIIVSIGLPTLVRITLRVSPD